MVHDNAKRKPLKFYIVVTIANIGILLFLFATPAYSSTPEHKALIKQSNENMIYVPGGSFMMGDEAFTEDLAGHKTDEFWVGAYEMKPAHKVTLDGFYLSKFEVTNDQFEIYVKAKKVKWEKRPVEAYFKDYPVVAR